MIVFNDSNPLITTGFNKDVFVSDRCTSVRLGTHNDKYITLTQIVSVFFDEKGLYIKDNTICPGMFDLLRNKDLIVECEVQIAGVNAETFEKVNMKHIFENLQLKEIKGGFNTYDQFTYVFQYINL